MVSSLDPSNPDLKKPKPRSAELSYFVSSRRGEVLGVGLTAKTTIFLTDNKFNLKVFSTVFFFLDFLFFLSLLVVKHFSFFIIIILSKCF